MNKVDHSSSENLSRNLGKANLVISDCIKCLSAL